MTNAAIGHGSKFERGDGGSPENFGTVGEVTSITPPNMSKDTVDGTHMESPERWREFIAGLKDGGEVSVEVNFDPDNQTTTDALGDINEDVSRNYKITFPDSTEWTFAAFCTGIEPSDPLDDKMTATFTYKLTGKPGFIA